MEEKDFSILGVGLLGFFFGIYDGKKMEEAKAFMGQWVYEHGGVDKEIERIICDGRRAVSHLLISVSILANDSRVERGVVYVKPIQSIPLILILNYTNYMEGIIHNNELHVLVFQHHSENMCLECSLYDLCTEENEYESMRYDLCEKLEPGEVGHFEHVYIPKSYTDEDR